MEPVDLLLFAARVFEDLGIQYAVVGSMASSYFGDARMTNIIHPDSGLKLDVMIPTDGEHSQIELTRRLKVKPVGSDDTAFLAAPEDIIIKKMEFYREGGSEKHLRDIAGMLKVSGAIIDRSYITQWAGKIGLDEIWNEIQKRVPI